MYKTLLVFDNYDLLEDIKNLSIWGDSSEFEITNVVNDGVSAYRKIRENRYDLVITEIRIMGMDGLQLLRNVKKREYVPILCYVVNLKILIMLVRE